MQLSAAQRPKYYKKGMKIPKKYAAYKYDKLGFLLDPIGNKVVKNVRIVGTPKVRKVNGQDLYSGELDGRTRAKIVLVLKEAFKQVLKGIPPITTFPIRVRMELHDVIGVGNWDADNLWLHNKCFQDALTDSGIIPDDNIMYITLPGAPEFTPVESEDDRQLVFIIEEEKREVITKNATYVEFHSKSGEREANPDGSGRARKVRRKAVSS